MGRHRTHVPVFADQHGHRTRLVVLAVRAATVVLLVGLAAVGLSLVSGVSLPGVTPPARLPADERPVRHAEPTSVSTVGLPGESPALPLPSGPAGLPAPGSSTPTSVRPSSQAPSPGATPTPTPTPSPTAPASTHGNQPTTTSHGRAPGTPPGHTKHP